MTNEEKMKNQYVSLADKIKDPTLKASYLDHFECNKGYYKAISEGKVPHMKQYSMTELFESNVARFVMRVRSD